MIGTKAPPSQVIDPPSPVVTKLWVPYFRGMIRQGKCNLHVGAIFVAKGYADWVQIS